MTEQQSVGLSTFVGTFSLPCLIFVSLATIDLSSVYWYFLLAIFLSKAVIFVAVLLVTLLVTRPVDPARAGLYAIFTTQSNDFAIGFPIGKWNPHVAWYIHSIALLLIIFKKKISTTNIFISNESFVSHLISNSINLL